MEKRKATKKKRRSGSTRKGTSRRTGSSSSSSSSTSRRIKKLNPITRLSWPGDDVGIEQGLVNNNNNNNAISSTYSSGSTIIGGDSSLLMKRQLSQSSQLSQSLSFSLTQAQTNIRTKTKSPSYLFSENLSLTTSINDSSNGNKRPKSASKTTQYSSSSSSSYSSAISISAQGRNNTNGKKENDTGNGKDKDNRLWVDKYRPTSIKDLCVAPKKINEVREWLETFTNNNNNNNNNNDNDNSNFAYRQYRRNNYINNNNSSSKLLILVGSGGIGKSTLIHVLAKELHWKVSKWNEMHNVKISSPTASSSFFSSSTFISPESQLSSFEEFLFSSALGCNITVLNDNKNSYDGDGNGDGNGDATSQYICNKSLVLIDEIPNLHGSQNEARFRQIMTQYIQKAQIPTILIYSDVYEGKHNPDELEKIIDPIILSSPTMTKIIQINPVTKTKMNQCIARIIKGEYERKNMNGLDRKYSKRNRNSGCSSAKGRHSVNLPPDLLEEIHAQSGGDLRHAIMTLQFQFGSDIDRSLKKLNSLGSSSTRFCTTNTANRDVRLSTFHALGKLLYAKRNVHTTTISSNMDSNIPPGESILSSFHNYSWNKDRRPPLEFEPERVLEDSAIGLNGALHFMGYHSPDFFTDITELSTAFGRFSDAALFLDKSYGTINDTSYPHGYAASIISRSVADANKHPMPTKFRQFHAPKVFEAMRKARENQSQVDRLCKRLSTRFDHLGLRAPVWASSSFSLEHFPWLNKIIPEEVSSLSTNIYSNDCFVVGKERYSNENPTNNLGSNTFEKKIEEQRKLLIIDDIEDCPSDEDEMNSMKAEDDKNILISNNKSLHYGIQSSTKSDIIIIDHD